MLPACHQLVGAVLVQRGHEAALGLPQRRQFLGALVDARGQARQVGRAQGRGLHAGRAHYGNAQQVGLELHEQVVDAGAAVHAQFADRHAAGDHRVAAHGRQQRRALERDALQRGAGDVRQRAAAAQAAEQFGSAHMLSSVCQPGIEAVAQAAPDALRLFQLYVHGDAAWVDAIAERVEAAGNGAFCLTVDTAHYSRRERDQAKRNIRRLAVPGREFQPQLTWKDVDRLKSKLKVPLILKGIATAEDAAMAVDHGVDMVYVSNHGGRQLDHCLGSMAVLPEVVKAVNGQATVIVDGSFNRGSDIVKAIASGAHMVGMGRMQCIGLAADGAAGVVRMLEILEDEIKICMGLIGVNSLAELNPSYLQAVAPLSPNDALSAFPLLSLDEKAFY